MMTADQETTNLGLQLLSMFIYNVIKNKPSLKKKNLHSTQNKTDIFIKIVLIGS